jgi:membrane fusion protein (multidrug efflux system)
LLRAVIPNPQGELLPGILVRAQLSQGVKRDAFLVPQRGVTRNRKGDATVMLVGPQNKVAERVVKAERSVGDQWLITAGLMAGNRVIVDGLQKVHDGITVKTIPAQEASASGSLSSAVQR